MKTPMHILMSQANIDIESPKAKQFIQMEYDAMKNVWNNAMVCDTKESFDEFYQITYGDDERK